MNKARIPGARSHLASAVKELPRMKVHLLQTKLCLNQSDTLLHEMVEAAERALENYDAAVGAIVPVMEKVTEEPIATNDPAAREYPDMTTEALRAVKRQRQGHA